MSVNNGKEVRKSAVEIDKFSLDEEWVRQAKVFLHWAEKLAQAELELDEAKAELEVTDADLELDIRKFPSRYDVPKVTEKAVEKTILVQKAHKESLKAVNQAKYAVAILRAKVRALEHKKAGLENLVTLQGQSYFAEPRASRDTSDLVHEYEQKAARSQKRRGQ